MILTSYIQALIILIEKEKITLNDIKNDEYRSEVEKYLNL